MFDTNTPIVVTAIKGQALSQAVYGTIRNSGGDAEQAFELLLGAPIGADGAVLSQRHPVRTAENRIYIDGEAEIDFVAVTASTIPDGVAGVHRCKMAADHTGDHEWLKGTDYAAILGADGQALRFIQRNGTAKCPICVRKDAYVAKQKRAKATAEDATAARVEEATQAPKPKARKQAVAV